MSTNRMDATAGQSIRSTCTLGVTLGTLAILAALPGCAPSADQAQEQERPREAGVLAGFAARSAEEDSTVVLRRVLAGPDVDLTGASVSPDGRYLTFVDWGDTLGDLMLREVATGAVERVTYDAVRPRPSGWAEEAVISPDGDRIAYSWWSETAAAYNHYELRIIRRGERESRLLYRSQECEYPQLWGWSPTGAEVLFLGAMKDGTRRLMAVSPVDGSTRTLADLGSGLDPHRGAIAPDGRHAAFSRLEAGKNDRDIYVVDLADGSTAPLVRNPGDDYILGWAPGGSHILFASDRAGPLGAWLQPVQNGRPVGAPQLVKAELWRAEPIGFTQDGSFFFGIPLSSRQVYTAELDPASWRMLSIPTPVGSGQLTLEGFPKWSPDGRYLAYYRWDQRGSSGRTRIVIRDTGTGETREITPDVLRPLGGIQWYPDGAHVLVFGYDPDRRPGLFRVNRDTGETDPVLSSEDLAAYSFFGWGPAGRSVFLTLFLEGTLSRMARVDLETGERTILAEAPFGYFPALSPDGRLIAFGSEEDGSPTLVVMPATGGARRLVARLGGPDSLRSALDIRGIAWSRDGKTLVFASNADAGSGLWHVPVSGGPVERITIQNGGAATFRDPGAVQMHPDGHRIAFDVGESNGEIWVMEDFLPGGG